MTIGRRFGHDVSSNHLISPWAIIDNYLLP
jgi:hypothetical protein